MNACYRVNCARSLFHAPTSSRPIASNLPRVRPGPFRGVNARFRIVTPYAAMLLCICTYVHTYVERCRMERILLSRRNSAVGLYSPIRPGSRSRGSRSVASSGDEIVRETFEMGAPVSRRQRMTTGHRSVNDHLANAYFRCATNDTFFSFLLLLLVLLVFLFFFNEDIREYSVQKYIWDNYV